MGFTIRAFCNDCGYKTKSIAVGGGRLNHLTNCGAPALNIESNEIEEINLYEYEKTTILKRKFLFFFNRSITITTKNSKYVPYYEPSIFIDDVEVGNHRWGNKCYKKSKNFCPKCKSYTVDFLDEGIMFD